MMSVTRAWWNIFEGIPAGDTVFDPFAGYGTTLMVAERLGRIPFGVEISQEKAGFIRSKLAQPENLFQGDSRFLADMPLPAIDFSMTSPPYTSMDDQDDPFTNYESKGRGYAAYLRDIRSIYGQLRGHMKPGGAVILEVSNIKRNGRVTTLAWDIAHEISTVLHFEGEVVVCWDKYGYGYDHSYCLIYSAL
jgi:DNA modification methylase